MVNDFKRKHPGTLVLVEKDDLKIMHAGLVAKLKDGTFRSFVIVNR